MRWDNSGRFSRIAACRRLRSAASSRLLPSSFVAAWARARRRSGIGPVNTLLIALLGSLATAKPVPKRTRLVNLAIEFLDLNRETTNAPMRPSCSASSEAVVLTRSVRLMRIFAILARTARCEPPTYSKTMDLMLMLRIRPAQRTRSTSAGHQCGNVGSACNDEPAIGGSPLPGIS